MSSANNSKFNDDKSTVFLPPRITIEPILTIPLIKRIPGEKIYESKTIKISDTDNGTCISLNVRIKAIALYDIDNISKMINDDNKGNIGLPTLSVSKKVEDALHIHRLDSWKTLPKTSKNELDIRAGFYIACRKKIHDQSNYQYLNMVIWNYPYWISRDEFSEMDRRVMEGGCSSWIIYIIKYGKIHLYA